VGAGVTRPERQTVRVQARRSGDLRRVVALLTGWQREVYLALVVLGRGAQRRVVTRQTLTEPVRLARMMRRVGSGSVIPQQAINLAVERLLLKGLVEYAPGGRGRYRLTTACPLPAGYPIALPGPGPGARDRLALPAPPARPVVLALPPPARRLALPAPAPIPRLMAPRPLTLPRALRVAELALRLLETVYEALDAGVTIPVLTPTQRRVLRMLHVRVEEILRSQYPDADRPRRGVRGRSRERGR
jgi:hypothetical protein